MKKTLPSPYPHQKERLWEIFHALQTHDSILVQDVTGSGKGFMSGFIFSQCQKRNKNIMFMVHGLTVIDAFCDELSDWVGEDEFTRFQAGQDYDHTKNAIIASADTISRRYFAKNANFNKDDLPRVDYIIADECRTLQSPTYVKLLNWYMDQGAKIIGLDATPDAPRLAEIYQKLLPGKPTQWYIDKGYLVPVTHYAPNANDVRFVKGVRDLKLLGGEYVDKDIQTFSEANTVLVGNVVTQYERISIAEYGEYRRFVVACANKAHARSVQAAFLEAGHNVAYIDGDTPQEERSEIKAQMEANEVMGIISVQVMIYGANWKFLEIAILARLTKKASVMLQFGGRVLRNYPGKEKAVFVDMGLAINDIGYLTDVYHWSLDPKEAFNETREARQEKKERKEVDITCKGCGHVYQNSPICPKCQTQNVVTSGETGVVYYDRELKKLDKEREKARQERQEQVDFVSKLKWYVDNVIDVTSDLDKSVKFNEILWNRYKYTLPPPEINAIIGIPDCGIIEKRKKHMRLRQRFAQSKNRG